jgi:hypothetical protein
MKTLREPDWKRNISTGFWGLGYRVQDRLDVVLLSNGIDILRDSDHLWPFLLMRDGKRDTGAERSLEARCDLRGLLESRPLEHETILHVRKDDFEELLSALRRSA